MDGKDLAERKIQEYAKREYEDYESVLRQNAEEVLDIKVPEIPESSSVINIKFLERLLKSNGHEDLTVRLFRVYGDKILEKHNEFRQNVQNETHSMMKAAMSVIEKANRALDKQNKRMED